jgi:hypothetical protein
MGDATSAADTITVKHHPIEPTLIALPTRLIGPVPTLPIAPGGSCSCLGPPRRVGPRRLARTVLI